MSDFRTFEFEVGFLFRDKLKKNELEASFKRLSKLERFDGVKKIVRDDDTDIFATLTSKDNRLRLSLTTYDISLSFINRSLEDNVKKDFIDTFQTGKKSLEVINEFPIEGFRSSHLFYGQYKKDRNSILKSIIQPALIKGVDDFRIGLYLPQDNSRGMEVTNHLYITTSHTTEMHNVLKKLKKQKYLKNLITVDHNRSIFSEKLTIADVEKFFQDEPEELTIDRSLNRLRQYG
jgi:hypothetical protein